MIENVIQSSTKVFFSRIIKKVECNSTDIFNERLKYKIDEIGFSHVKFLIK